MAWPIELSGTAEDLNGILHCWTRRNILLVLSGARRDARTIAQLLAVSPSLFSTQAHELERWGLVSLEREGQHLYWSLSRAAVVIPSQQGLEFVLHAPDGGRVAQYIPFTTVLASM